MTPPAPMFVQTQQEPGSQNSVNSPVLSELHSSQSANLHYSLVFQKYKQAQRHTEPAVNMFASRSMKPKLSLNIVTGAPAPTSAATRPVLSLAIKSPVTPTAMAPLKSPISLSTPAPAFTQSPIAMSPAPMSPTAFNTKMNARGFSSMAQQPTYSYINNAASRSILKKSQSNTSRRRIAQLQFSEDPTVYSVSPIEDPEYYGAYQTMTREERRWMVRT